MSQDPYPSERPDPHASGPSEPYGDAYSEDPYVRGDQPTGRPPAPLSPQPPFPVAGPGPTPGPGIPPYPYAPPPPPNTSAIVLTVLSGLAVVTGYCCVIGIGPLVLGILGITKNASDPEGAARLTKIGWIVFAALTLLAVLAVAGLVLAVTLTGA